MKCAIPNFQKKQEQLNQKFTQNIKFRKIQHFFSANGNFPKGYVLSALPNIPIQIGIKAQILKQNDLAYCFQVKCHLDKFQCCLNIYLTRKRN